MLFRRIHRFRRRRCHPVHDRECRGDCVRDWSFVDSRRLDPYLWSGAEAGIGETLLYRCNKDSQVLADVRTVLAEPANIGRPW